MTNKFTRKRTTLLVGSMAAVLVGFLIGVSYTETASAGGLTTRVQCDDGNGISEHFDKILFSSTKGAIGDGPAVRADRPYEVIAFVDFPTTIIDPIQDVLDVLNANGYAKLNGNPLRVGNISIIDVEYAIICVSQAPQ